VRANRRAVGIDPKQCRRRERRSQESVATSTHFSVKPPRRPTRWSSSGFRRKGGRSAGMSQNETGRRTWKLSLAYHRERAHRACVRGRPSGEYGRPLDGVPCDAELTHTHPRNLDGHSGAGAAARQCCWGSLDGGNVARGTRRELLRVHQLS
jgi:hypothetical protein